MDGNSDFTILSKSVSRAGRGKLTRVASSALDERADAASLYSVSGARKYLNGEERNRVLAAIGSLPTDQALFALTLAWTGARVSEVLALRPSHFQIARGLVAIRTLKRRRHSVREVPLPPELTMALDRHFSLALAQSASETSGRLLWPWCRQTAWRRIKQTMARAGISGRAASPRGLRHAFGIGTLQAGVPLNLVQRWLGHAQISTTAIYAAAAGPEEIAFAARFWRVEPERLAADIGRSALGGGTRR